MKAPKNKVLICLSIFLLLMYQNSYSQLIYNWNEYHIINNSADNKALEGHVLSSTKTTFKPTLPKSTDNVQLKNLCTNCSNQVWVIAISANNYSSRSENEYYGYIKIKPLENI